MDRPYPVKLIAAVLAGSPERTQVARLHLEDLLGAADFISEPVPFDHTEYYRDEMGGNLMRWILSFADLADPGDLVRVKLATIDIEGALAAGGRRTVNIDPGYLDYHKLVLASTKYNGNRVYIGRGVWADITLFYGKGRFTAPEWSFPDFKTGAYDRALLEIRMRYKQAMKRDTGEIGGEPRAEGRDVRGR